MRTLRIVEQAVKQYEQSLNTINENNYVSSTYDDYGRPITQTHHSGTLSKTTSMAYDGLKSNEFGQTAKNSMYGGDPTNIATPKSFSPFGRGYLKAFKHFKSMLSNGQNFGNFLDKLNTSQPTFDTVFKGNKYYLYPQGSDTNVTHWSVKTNF